MTPAAHHWITWPLLFPVIGIAAFIAVLIWGAMKFSDKRAIGVKKVEDEMAIEVVMEQVVRVAPGHPEIVRLHRLDRHPFYLLIHAGVFGYAVSIFMGAMPTSNVSALGEATRFTMAACFVVGAGLILVSSAMGTKILGRWWFARNVKEHMTCAILGDDVTLPYRTGCAGMFAVCVSMTIYSTTSFKSTSGSLGGWATGACAVACVVLIPMLYRATRVFDKWDRILIEEAWTELDQSDYDGE